MNYFNHIEEWWDLERWVKRLCFQCLYGRSQLPITPVFRNTKSSSDLLVYQAPTWHTDIYIAKTLIDINNFKNQLKKGGV